MYTFHARKRDTDIKYLQWLFLHQKIRLDFLFAPFLEKMRKVSTRFANDEFRKNYQEKKGRKKLFFFA